MQELGEGIAPERQTDTVEEFHGQRQIPVGHIGQWRESARLQETGWRGQVIGQRVEVMWRRQCAKSRSK